MAKPVVLPRSQRERLSWRFHELLDTVEDGPEARAQFADMILRELGVSWWRRRGTVKRLIGQLPAERDEIDMNDLLALLEPLLPLQWLDDVQVVPGAAAGEFRSRLLQLLGGEGRSALPKDVAARIMELVTATVGERLDPALLPEAEMALKELLISQLWRCNDAAARGRLAKDVLFQLKTRLKLDLG